MNLTQEPFVSNTSLVRFDQVLVNLVISLLQIISLKLFLFRLLRDHLALDIEISTFDLVFSFILLPGLQEGWVADAEYFMEP